ncbi:T/G mismatch-specific endonuclease [Klenkia soli]|uniref:T/G mismatch-specific endonuclease n=1 Tax=Klenkia soli TaxID=1052260 RepID=A0A1H0QYS4_9ACTN|nr:endonuclease domain-containing protein [Klenkia soli]SDP22463.1 T/G mismatch-specific endonuclease [Klenkia soli]
MLDEPFRGADAVRAGWLTTDVLRGPRVRVLLRGVHVAADVPEDPLLRSRAALVRWPDAVVTGSSALQIWRLPVPDRDQDLLELTRPPGTHPVRAAGCRVRRAVLHPDDVVSGLGLRFLSADAAALEVLGRLSLDEGVTFADRWTSSGSLRLDALRAAAAGRTGRGCARAREALDLADGLAESPPETWLRLLVLRSGLPAPVAQFVVRQAGGRFVARVDFAWPERRVALEYDGAWHGEPGQLARDRRRLDALADAGWRVTFATAADRRDPTALLTRLARLLG